MSSIQTTFDHYEIVFVSAGDSKNSMSISLFKGDIYIGRLYFYKENTTLPKNHTRGGDGDEKIIYLHFYESYFHEIISMLRNEEPLEMLVDDKGWGWIGTKEGEPVGDE